MTLTSAMKRVAQLELKGVFWVPESSVIPKKLGYSKLMPPRFQMFKNHRKSFIRNNPNHEYHTYFTMIVGNVDLQPLTTN